MQDDRRAGLEPADGVRLEVTLIRRHQHHLKRPVLVRERARLAALARRPAVVGVVAGRAEVAVQLEEAVQGRVARCHVDELLCPVPVRARRNCLHHEVGVSRQQVRRLPQQLPVRVGPEAPNLPVLRLHDAVLIASKDGARAAAVEGAGVAEARGGGGGEAAGGDLPVDSLHVVVDRADCAGVGVRIGVGAEE
eukprot:764529-Hanusia_phi.AAC.1